MKAETKKRPHILFLHEESLDSETLEITAEKKILAHIQTELQWLKRILTFLFCVNTLAAIFNLVVFINSSIPDPFLSSALLSLLASIVIRIALCKIDTSSNLIEIWILTMLGIYVPLLVLWQSANSLLPLLISIHI